MAPRCPPDTGWPKKCTSRGHGKSPQQTAALNTNPLGSPSTCNSRPPSMLFRAPGALRAPGGQIDIRARRVRTPQLSTSPERGHMKIPEVSSICKLCGIRFQASAALAIDITFLEVIGICILCPSISLKGSAQRQSRKVLGAAGGPWGNKSGQYRNMCDGCKAGGPTNNLVGDERHTLRRVAHDGHAQEVHQGAVGRVARPTEHVWHAGIVVLQCGVKLRSGGRLWWLTRTDTPNDGDFAGRRQTPL